MADHTRTIQAALAWATDVLRATSPTPRLDAELLLAYVTGFSRARLLAEARALLAEAQAHQFSALVQRRIALEPVAYLIGRREFYGLDFQVDQRVLVPRPETELLVELAIARGQGSGVRGQEPLASQLRIADVGTGSGAIAVALALHLPAAQVIAVDISLDALAVARANIARHGLAGRIELLTGDLLEPVRTPVDLLVSNPPYTILSEIDEGVRRHEPQRALDGGADGLDLYRRLLAQAPAKLRSNGAVLLEIGAWQAAAVVALAQQYFPNAAVRVHQDLAGLDRVVVIETDGRRKTEDE